MEDPIVKSLAPKFEGAIIGWLDRELVPGAAIGIVRGDELVYARGFGYADLESERAMDADTIFRCGSITKTFTATAIMQLRDEGKLDLDEPLLRFIPEFAAVKARAGSVEKVTLRRLLMHTSGLAAEGPNNGWERLEFPSIEGMLAALPQTEILIEPDSQYKYSNLGFALMGEAIARVSKMPYAEYIQRNILAPLAMSSSGFALTDATAPRMATGYTIRALEGAPPVAPHPALQGWTAAGALYSSVNDLARWIALQFRIAAPARAGAQVLKGASLTAMHRAQFMESNWAAGYGLAWRADRRGENIYHHHSGGIHGFLTKITFNKLHKLGTIVLTNGNPNLAFEILSFEILEMLIGALRDSAPAPTLRRLIPTPEKYRGFIGRYEDPQIGGIVWIASRNGELVIINPGSAVMAPAADQRLIPTVDPLVFTLDAGRPAGEPLVFRVNAHGKVTSLLMSHSWAFRKVEPVE